MSTFSECFKDYINIEKLPLLISGSNILNILIDSGNRSIKVFAEFSGLVDRQSLFTAEKMICECSLDLAQCRIYSPRH